MTEIEPETGQRQGDDALAQVNPETLRIIHDELNLRRASFSTRWSGTDTKSALLVTAAGVLTGLQLRDGASMLSKASAVVALLAAVGGIASLWPRHTKDMDAGRIRDRLLSLAPLAAELSLVDTKIDVHERDEALLGVRAKWLRLGFGLIVLSVLIATVSVVVR